MNRAAGEVQTCSQIPFGLLSFSVATVIMAQIYPTVIILAIETSCDETAVSVVKVENGCFTVLSNAISSQVKLHAQYGGVVPNLAAREHEKNLPIIFESSLHEAALEIENIDLIAVTVGPGLAPALVRGLRFAKEVAIKHKKPLIGVNHLEGHIYSNWLKPVGETSDFQIQNPKLFPALNLIVSGGHTELVLMNDYGQFEIIGETLDDAIGEAFDKVARILDLGYPGGPIVSKMAETGNSDKFPLPVPMAKSKDFNFSYSGLKTAVLYLVRDLEKPLSEQTKSDICASFQKSAIEILLKKTAKAAEEFKAKTVLLSGGVSANKYLRENLAKTCTEIGIPLSKPEFVYTGDNAAMIAAAGYFNYVSVKNKKIFENFESLDINANLNLGQTTTPNN